MQHPSTKLYCTVALKPCTVVLYVHGLRNSRSLQESSLAEVCFSMALRNTLHDWSNESTHTAWWGPRLNCKEPDCYCMRLNARQRLLWIAYHPLVHTWAAPVEAFGGFQSFLTLLALCGNQLQVYSTLVDIFQSGEDSFQCLRNRAECDMQSSTRNSKVSNLLTTVCNEMPSSQMCTSIASIKLKDRSNIPCLFAYPSHIKGPNRISLPSHPFLVSSSSDVRVNSSSTLRNTTLIAISLPRKDSESKDSHYSWKFRYATLDRCHSHASPLHSLPLFKLLHKLQCNGHPLRNCTLLRASYRVTHPAGS